MTRWTIPTACFLAAISTGVLTAAEPPAPRFTIPFMAKAPVIDGQVDPNEWSGALAFTGTLDGAGRLFSVPTTFYVGRDRQNIYWAYSSSPPGGRRVGPSGMGDENTWMKFAEAAWLHVFPNIDGPVGKRAWYWLITATDVKLDTRFGVDGGRVQEMWDGHWVIKHHVADGLWQTEISAPISDFTTGPIADGDVWGMNFAVRWSVPYALAIVSPDQEIGESANYERFCRMTFDSAAPALQITSLGDVARGKLALGGAINAADGQGGQLKLTAVLTSPMNSGARRSSSHSQRDRPPLPGRRSCPSSTRATCFGSWPSTRRSSRR